MDKQLVNKLQASKLLLWLFLFTFFPLLAIAQQHRVEGVVKDAAGIPLTGVSVSSGPNTGTATDFDGSYKIDVASDGQLTFSFIGMQPITEKVNNRKLINVTLHEDAIVLQNVVVTALGIKREEKALGYAVQKVEAEELTKVKGVNLATSLSGKIAGVLVKNSTNFGAAPTFLVRGEEPLLVVDGVPKKYMSMADIPADDVEDMSVLKGATASALYGSDGKNGAVMITTKRGKKATSLRVDVNSNTMFTAGHLAIPEKQAVFGRGTSGLYNRNADRVWGQVMDGTMLEQWNPHTMQLEMMPYLPVGKDNFQNFVNTGVITNNNISVSQGNENGSFRATGTWIYNKGQYPNNKMNKFNFGIGGDMKFNDFTLSSSISFNKHNSPNYGFNGYKNYDPMYSLLVWSGADYDIRDYKNNIWEIENEKQNNSYDSNQSTLDNAYFQQYGRTNSLDRDLFNASASLSYQIQPWLKATVRSGLDYLSTRQHTRIHQGAYAGSGENFWWQAKMKGLYAATQNSKWSTTNDLMFVADHRVGDFTVDGILGGAIFYQKEEYNHGRTSDGIMSPGYFSLKSSVKDAVAESSLSTKRTNSIYGKVGGSWKSMVYLEATLRNDWSSTLSSDERSFLYPSVGGSFIASELLPKNDWLSIWKLRGSWTVSKVEPAIYENNVGYTILTSQWGGMSTAKLPGSIRPSSLKPMKIVTNEVGTMASFFNNRFTVDFAYYEKRLEDRIQNASISPASGYSTSLVNTDEHITTKGFELTLHGTLVQTQDWKWDVTTNWSRYARYYSKLDEKYSSKQPWVKKGARADHYILDDDFERSPDGQVVHTEQGIPKKLPHKSLFGYADPDWVWGVSTNVKYKAFTLGIAVDGRIGGLTPTVTETYMWLAGTHPNSVTDARYADVENALNPQAGYKGIYVGDGVKVVSGGIRYTPDGQVLEDTRQFTPNDITVPYKYYIDNSHKNFIWGGTASPLDVYSTTFLKLREISLTYDLPKTFVKKFKANDASVSFVGQNVLMWAKDFKYSDPDGGSENFNEPSPRYLGVNIKLGF